MNRTISFCDRLPGQLYTSEQVRELDQRVMQHEKISSAELMLKAAQAAVAHLRERWPQAHNIAVLAGPGNNGGDAWLVAALARLQGLKVRCYSLGDHDHASPEAQQARARAVNAGVAVQLFSGELPVEAQVIVDGLIGIGLKGPVRKEYEQAIQVANAHPAPILALDIPSGLNADSGRIMGEAIRAEATVTFIGVKRGLLTADGPDCAGDVVFAPLGTRPEQHLPADAERISWHYLDVNGRRLASRSRNAHKGKFGHVLVVGGDLGMGGAALLATEAASRCGAGLVSCATRPEHLQVVLGRCPTAMVRGVTSGLELDPYLDRATVIAIGPGLGMTSWSELLLQRVLQTDKPLVLDADALNLLASPAWRQSFVERPVVLTPHPGEAARLLQCTTADIALDRFAAARKLAQQFNAVVVLKGQGSLIAAPDGRVALSTDGNSGMSTGGMGDVLTGVVAALLAQGMNAWEAACYAVCLHSAAADRCAEQSGARGMLASDLNEYLRELIN